MFILVSDFIPLTRDTVYFLTYIIPKTRITFCIPTARVDRKEKILLHHLASQGKHDEEALMGNRFVGIPFIFTALYDLPPFRVSVLGIP